MPSNYKSPFGTSFNSAIKNGTPCGVAIASIAKRCGKSHSVVGNSLFRAGLCFRQKFNGNFVFWPVHGKKCASAKWKPCHTDMWQCFIDWIICNGCCKPEQMNMHCSSQKEFMTWCRKFFAHQFGPATVSKSKSKRKTTKRKTMKTKTARHKTSSTRVYKFPRTTSRRTTRRKAA